MDNKDGQIEVVSEEKIIKVEQLYPFQRIDFNNPSTILNYGSDVLKEMETLVTKSIEATVTSETGEDNTLSRAEFKEKIKGLSEFDTELDKLEAKRNAKETGLVKFINIVKRKVTGKTGDGNSYGEQFKKYSDNVDDVALGIEEMNIRSKDTFRLFEGMINDIQPYILIFENVYNVGVSDLNEFLDEINKLEEEYNLNPNGILKAKIDTMKIHAEDLQVRLHSLQAKGVVVAQNITKWTMQQSNEFKQIILNEEFLGFDRHILKINGATLVRAKKQKEDAKIFGELVTSMNKALEDSSKSLYESIDAVNELSNNGNIWLKTIETSDDYIKKGRELQKKGEKERLENVRKSADILNKLLEASKDDMNDIQSRILIEENTEANKGYTKR